MDFNDIQSAWNKENNENIILPNDLDKIQSANMPLDKIKKNLKKELIFQIGSLILIGFLPCFFAFPAKGIAPFYLLYSLAIAVSVYFLIKLYLFYKRLNKVALKTKDSLYETYFDVRLNMELYKTFCFALTPFLVLSVVGRLFYFASLKPEFEMNSFTNLQWISVFVLVGVSILFMGLASEWWVNFYYGKYAKEIKKVIEELKEE